MNIQANDSIAARSDGNWLVILDRRDPASFWLIALAAHLPLMVIYLLAIWKHEHYQFIPFLLAAVGFLAWTRIRVAIALPVSRLAIALVAGAFLTLLVGSLIYSPWVGSVAFVLLVTGFLVNHEVGYLSIPLFLVVRAPLGYDTLIITWLQALTTRLASFLLDVLSVPHVAQGNVIELADRELFVAQACSGVQSAFTIAFVALLVIVWRQRPLILTPVYLLISLAWAVLCNTFRVTVIAFAASQWGADLSTGLLHDAIGYVALGLAIVLTWSTDCLLAIVFRPLDSIYATWVDNPIGIGWNWLFETDNRDIESGTVDLQTSGADGASVKTLIAHRPRVAFVSVLCVAILSALPMTARGVFQPTITNPSGELLIDPAPTLLDGLSQNSLVSFVQSMRNQRDPRLGMHADQWKIQNGGIEGAVIFSQPYPEWHNLNVCYTGQGWVVRSVQYLAPSNQVTNRTDVVVTQFTRGDGATGYLIFSGLTADGTVLPPPGVGVVGQFLDRCSNWLTPRLVFSGETAMLQLWVSVSGELDAEIISELVDTLAIARERFSSEMQASGRRELMQASSD